MPKRPEAKKVYGFFAAATQMGFENPLDFVLQQYLPGQSTWHLSPRDSIYGLAKGIPTPVASASLLWEVHANLPELKDIDPHTFSWMKDASHALSDPDLFLGPRFEDLFLLAKHIYGFPNIQYYINILSRYLPEISIMKLQEYYWALETRLTEEFDPREGKTYALMSDRVFGFIGSDSITRGKGKVEEELVEYFDRLVQIAAREIQLKEFLEKTPVLDSLYL
ncbi:hypothetical protein HY357_04465 [Candidatus Roizmanbacteria bacterium]|nr:hypothetical protein [Candidatus Roizmanbacteria bacterium]